MAVFFDRQLIYDLIGKWPGPSYGHGSEGYLEFIHERLGNDVRVSEVLIPVITMKSEVVRTPHAHVVVGRSSSGVTVRSVKEFKDK